MSILYTDIDPKTCKWIEMLIKEGCIPQGDVWCRDIATVQPEEVAGYTQRHWFCGVAGWPLALKLAGWPTTRQIDTASLPCQPFSNAGKRKGNSDERHLWPVFARLVKALKPETIAGEQVASTEIVGTQLEVDFAIAVQSGDFARANKLAKRLVAQSGFHFHPRWIDGISSDLGKENYSMRFCVLGAHSVRSPNIRQRLFWLAHARFRSVRSNRESRDIPCEASGMQGETRQQRIRVDVGDGGSNVGMADRNIQRCDGKQVPVFVWGSQQASIEVAGSGCDSGMGDTAGGRQSQGHSTEQARFNHKTGYWDSCTTIPCGDGKTRRIEPGLEPLVDGIPRGVVPGGDPRSSEYARKTGEARVMRLKGFGNAIVPQVAAEFIQAYLETGDQT